MDFDLRLLRCALALAEQRNFARAAKAVHVSQPALSRAIQELEQRAGTRLFDRSASGVEPTDAGVVLLQHAREVMSRAEDLGREMNLLRGLDKGELRIAAGTYPTSMYLSRALARLVSKHPDVRLSVVTENWANLLPLLRKREVDLAVIDATAAEGDPEMRVVPLMTYQGYLVLRAGHPLLQLDRERRAEETWNYPFVTTSRFPPAMFKGLAEALLGPQKDDLGSKALVSVACESLEMMRDIARESDAIAILPLNVVIDDIERGELVAIPAPSWARAKFGIVHLAHRSLSPLGETFVRLVQEADRELLDWQLKAAERLFALRQKTVERFSRSASTRAVAR